MINTRMRAGKFLVAMGDAVLLEPHGQLSRSVVNMELILPPAINVNAAQLC